MRAIARTATALLATLIAILVVPVETRAGGESDRAADGATERVSAKVKHIQKQVRACTNRRRIKHGLPTLAPAKPLTRAASLLATEMSRHDFFDHIDQEGRDVSDRVAIFAPKSRYIPIGENIGAGYEGARGVCKGWMKSASHRANILDPDYTVIGAGFDDGGEYGTYYVQVFGRGPRH